MVFDEDDRAPEVISMKNVMLALVMHVAVFALFWIFSILNFKPKETVIPIELTFEAPPDEVAPDEPQPQPEPPKPEVKMPEPPPVEEKLEAVEQVHEKKKPEKKPEKKPDPPKEKPKPKEPEKPQKTKEQIKKEKEEARKKRLEAMRKGAKVVKDPKPTPVAGTGEKLDPNWRKLLGQGYKPSDKTQIATSEMQRCVSLIKMALDNRWNQMSPDIGRPGTVVLRVSITPAGQLVNCKVAKSCGDPLSDKAALAVASTTGRVAGLSPEFIRQNPTLTINYTVEER